MSYLRDRLIGSLSSMRATLMVMQRTADDDEVAEFVHDLEKALHLIRTHPDVEVPTSVVLEAEAAERRVEDMVTVAVRARLQ